MCGRYVLADDPIELGAEFDAQLESTLIGAQYRANYNITPGVNIPVISANSGVRLITEVRWGMLPKWSQNSSTLLINARGESVTEKVTFAKSFATSRILIPATGYYEWKRPQKDPYFISPPLGDSRPMAMAGLIADSLINGRVVPTCVIITVSAVPDLASIHDRMPACVDSANWDAWLDPSVDVHEASNFLVGRTDLRAFRVDRAVNSVRNNSPVLIQEFNEED